MELSEEKNVVSTRNIAGEIVEEFERFLDKKNIYISSEDRERHEGELLDAVEDIVYSALTVVKNKPELEILKGVLY